MFEYRFLQRRRIIPLALGAGAILSAAAMTPLRSAPFVRGNANGRGGIDISDAVRIFTGLFLGQPLPCLDAADVDDSGRLEVTDGIYLLEYLFRSGREPPAPFPFCGLDGTGDDMSCVSFEGCICGGIAAFPCDEGEICDPSPGFCGGADIAGTCVPRVDGGCPEIFAPVCGCDGVTYDNDCFRLSAGVAKDHDGRCGEARICGGIAGLPCEDGELCDLPAGECQGADLVGECVPQGKACPAVFDPVCGCDGVTYGNDCERILAGAQKDHDGACR